MKQIRLCIIGGGSRGTLVLERILAHLLSYGYRCELFITIIDPGTIGCGIHELDQPDYILFNTIAALPTAFPDPAQFPRTPGIGGKTLAEWLTSKSPLREEYDLNSYPPRAQVGAYLQYAAKHIIGNFPQGVGFEHMKDVALDVIERPNGEFTVLTRSGRRIDADALFITTGHGVSRTPEKEQMKRVRDLEPTVSSIAVIGLGLSAHDIVAQLIAAHEGSFERDSEGTLRYHPSGKEPKIYLFSRSGLPYRARSIVDGSIGPKHLRFLKDALITQLEIIQKDLDILRDVEPFMKLEVFYQFCVFIRDNQLAQYGERIQKILEMLSQEDIPSLQFVNRFLQMNRDVLDVEDEFYPRSLLNAEDSSSYHESMLAFLRDDLVEASQGLAKSPRKFAFEALLIARPFFKNLVDRRIISGNARSEFFRYLAPLINRQVIGPQFERNEEWIALSEAGILSFAVGPHPEIAGKPGDWNLQSSYPGESALLVEHFFEAFAPPWSVAPPADDFLENVIRRGLVTSQSIEHTCLKDLLLSPSNQVCDKNGIAVRPIWILGPPAEGATYYNNYIPIRNNDADLPFLEAHQAVKDLFSHFSLGENLPPSG